MKKLPNKLPGLAILEQYPGLSVAQGPIKGKVVLRYGGVEKVYSVSGADLVPADQALKYHAKNLAEGLTKLLELSATPEIQNLIRLKESFPASSVTGQMFIFHANRKEGHPLLRIEVSAAWVSTDFAGWSLDIEDCSRVYSGYETQVALQPKMGGSQSYPILEVWEAYCDGSARFMAQEASRASEPFAKVFRTPGGGIRWEIPQWKAMGEARSLDEAQNYVDALLRAGQYILLMP